MPAVDLLWFSSPLTLSSSRKMCTAMRPKQQADGAQRAQSSRKGTHHERREKTVLRLFAAMSAAMEHVSAREYSLTATQLRMSNGIPVTMLTSSLKSDTMHAPMPTRNEAVEQLCNYVFVTRHEIETVLGTKQNSLASCMPRVTGPPPKNTFKHSYLPSAEESGWTCSGDRTSSISCARCPKRKLCCQKWPLCANYLPPCDRAGKQEAVDLNWKRPFIFISCCLNTDPTSLEYFDCHARHRAPESSWKNDSRQDADVNSEPCSKNIFQSH